MAVLALESLAVPVDGPDHRPSLTERLVRSHMVANAESDTRLGSLGSVLYPIAQHPLLVQPSLVSPANSTNVMTDDELQRMLIEALDDFDEAPTGCGHVLDAREEEVSTSTSVYSPLSLFRSLPQQCINQGRVESAQPSALTKHRGWSTHHSASANQGLGQPTAVR